MNHFLGKSLGLEHAMEVWGTLHADRPLNGMPYTSSLLSYSPPSDYPTSALEQNRFFYFCDRLEPRARLMATHAILFWPGGNPAAENGNHWQVLGIKSDADHPPRTTADKMDETQFARRLTLGASIGEAALGRIHPIIHTMREQYHRAHGEHGNRVLSAEVRRLGIPLGMIEILKVTGGKLPTGTIQALLWHVAPAQPSWVLEQMRGAVQDVIAAESVPEP